MSRVHSANSHLNCSGFFWVTVSYIHRSWFGVIVIGRPANAFASNPAHPAARYRASHV
jgi:hypothetical protein